MDITNDFDDLLNDFINKEVEDFEWDSFTDEETECAVVPELEPFTSKGITYQVPVVCEPEFRFRKLNLLAKTGELDSETEKSSLILWDDNQSEDLLFLEMEDICQASDEFPCSDVISVFLYRVGTPEPLKVYSKRVGDSVCTATTDLSDINGKWIPGEYFLLVVNASCQDDESLSHWDTFHSHMRYSFRLLANGRGLEHPSITEFSLDSDQKLEVHLKGNAGYLDEFRFLMYDEDWFKIANSLAIGVYRNRMKTLLHISTPLLDGIYKMVMLHNDEPCTLVTVKWSENKLEDCSWEPLLPNTPYYMLAKYMDKDSDWRSLCDVPGCRSIRKAVVERYGYKVLHEWREKHDLFRVVKNIHLSVALVDGMYDSRLARLLVKLLNPSMDFKERNCELLLETKNAVDPYEDLKEALENCEGKVFCLHHLSALYTASNGKVFMHMLEEKIRETPNVTLMLMGTQAEIDLVFENSPFIARLIPTENRLHSDLFSAREQICFLKDFTKNMQIGLTSKTVAKFVEIIVSNRDMMDSWGCEELKQWWLEDIYPRFMNRMVGIGDQFGVGRELFFLEPEDICWPSKATPKDEFAESIRELNEMVGLEKLKQSMTTMFNRTRFDKMRREAGLPVLDKGGYHMVFTGNPGTGKTTVAKLIGQVFHSLGLLSKGGVIVTERSKLVGRYLGETEKNMSAVLEQARGNVLFIDEAYSLCDNDKGDRRDFGCRVLESLLTVLAQKNPDMIVILAGYEKEMNQMLEMNPGMKGRFPYKFNFEDYNADELYQIADGLLVKSEYVMTPVAELRLKEIIEETLLYKDAFFHNARWMEQFIMDGVVSAMSDRLMSSPYLQCRELLQTVEVQDIEMAYQKMKPKPVTVAAPRKRIGFVA